MCYEQVYYISKGKVKLANRAYASVKNDYAISLDGRCAKALHPSPPNVRRTCSSAAAVCHDQPLHMQLRFKSSAEAVWTLPRPDLDKYCANGRSVIEESEDQDASRMQAKLDFVAIDQLAKYIGNKVSPCCGAVAAAWLHAVALSPPHWGCHLDEDASLDLGLLHASCVTFAVLFDVAAPVRRAGGGDDGGAAGQHQAQERPVGAHTPRRHPPRQHVRDHRHTYDGVSYAPSYTPSMITAGQQAA